MSKIQILFKTPYAGTDAIKEHFEDSELDEDDLLAQREKLELFLEKYLRNDEYVTIEFDSINETATVLKVK